MTGKTRDTVLGKDDYHRSGGALLISSKAQRALLTYHPVDNRIITDSEQGLEQLSLCRCIHGLRIHQTSI